MHSNAEILAATCGRVDAEHSSANARQEPAAKSSLKIVPSPYFHVKGMLGRILALILLLPGSLIIAGLVLLVRLTSRGPAIYCQTRVGRHGREFKMYKIRTMYEDAESRFGPEWTQKNDPRITPVGRWLRKLHLDEFPQLLNVLKGEMTLIGPRPERPEFTRVLAKEIPNYLDRLLVAPGITGLAQINLPPDMDLNSVRRKLVLDLEYIQHASPLLDLRMFASTLMRLLFINGDFAMKIMGLEREVPSLDPHAEVTLEGHRTPESILASQMANAANNNSNNNKKAAGASNGATNGKAIINPPHLTTDREVARANGSPKNPQSLDDRLTVN
jgi:lipopolysaccharide/colanic/teichoic acid biosynthesis glycosyltransferase